MTEENNISEEVKQALTESQDQIALETIQDEDSSPLNRPVIEKDIGGEKQTLEQEQSEPWNVWKPEMKEGEDSDSSNQSPNYRKDVEDRIEAEKANEPLDAPEQEISSDGEYDDNGETITNKDFEIPLAQANQAATALLGMTNNVLSAGGGLLVKIKKQSDFYEYGEVVTVIDQQNEKNVDRILLDKEDKALLRPLLAEVLRKKAKKLTPEQQLLGAVASIVMKKAQVVMEIRAENSVLEDRISAIIKEQKKESDSEETFEENEGDNGDSMKNDNTNIAEQDEEDYNVVQQTEEPTIYQDSTLEYSEDQTQKES